MAKKPTEKQLYKLKNEWLGQFFEEVKPKEFYRAVFPEGSFERAGQGKRKNSPTIVPIGTAVGTMQRLPTAEDTTMLPGNSTITMYQMTSGKPGKRPGKNFSLVFLFCL